jgi:histidinol-phosphatase (PHP family)
MNLAAPALPVIVDLHAHTHHSHGQASTEAMYLAAKDKGLKVFGFSEHSPRPAGYLYPTDYQEKLNSRFGQYVDEVRDMAARGKEDGLEVLLGLEVDYIRGQEAYAAELCRRHPFEYIIGGLHFQGTWGFDGPSDDWTPLSRTDRFAIYARYYDDLASMCATGLFHIAAHPDLIKIFSVDDFNAWLESPAALAKVTTALQAIKDNRMIMEVSSAGLRKPCKEIYPGQKIMALAAAMKLPISFASDAHCADTPGYAFAELARYAAGFGYSQSMVPQGGVMRAVPFSAPSAL